MVFKFVLFSSLILFFHLSLPFQDSIQSDTIQNDSLKIYQTEKLKYEIEKIKSENALDPILRTITTSVGLLTAIGAIIGAFLSYNKYLKERRSELEQRKWESDMRLEDQFNSIIENMGSDSDPLKASAVVSLLTFLKPEYKQFHEQAYLILLSSLKNYNSDNINRILVKAFEKALRINIESIQSKYAEDPESKEYMIELDLTRMNLYRIDLHGLNLEYLDVAFSDLRNANLTDCNLKRARGIQANLSGARLSRSNMTEARFNEAAFEDAQFHGTRLISATLKNSYLKGAEFQQALLQEAHLEGAHIEDAKFEHANLNNSFFKEVQFKDTDLKSILKSANGSWKKANFDAEVREKLDQLSR